MHAPDPAVRFSDRVADYVRYRPGYPAEVVRVLAEEIRLDPSWVVADVGSGTGLSTELFLDYGNRVFAIEPNPAMRQAGEARLGSRAGFTSIGARAEDTELPAASIDLVAAGQAFHWFDRDLVGHEFRRILKEPRWVVLFWNARHTDTSEFLRGYEALLREFSIDYEGVRHENVEDTLGPFFGGTCERRIVANEQIFDYESLQGRLLSSSYTPTPGHPARERMLDALRDLFVRTESGGRVRMTYDTRLFFGRLGAPSG